MVEISPVTGSASPAPGLASAPNLLPLSLAPAVRCSAPPPGPSRTLLLPRLLALHVTICGTILLCHCPHHPLVLLPPASLRFPASLPAPPSISSRLSSLLLWPCALPGISPYSPSFRLSAHTLSPLPLLSLSTSDPPPPFLIFLWLLMSPAISHFCHLGKCLPPPPTGRHPKTPPHPVSGTLHVSWRWGVTYQVWVASQDQGPDGRGDVG